MVSSLPPCAVPTWMNKLKNGAYMSNKILERCLLSHMTSGTYEKLTYILNFTCTI